jgi:hypothetical protein
MGLLRLRKDGSLSEALARGGGVGWPAQNPQRAPGARTECVAVILGYYISD